MPAGMLRARERRQVAVEGSTPPESGDHLFTYFNSGKNVLTPGTKAAPMPSPGHQWFFG
jgi:hypothetical protein